MTLNSSISGVIYHVRIGTPRYQTAHEIWSAQLIQVHSLQVYDLSIKINNGLPDFDYMPIRGFLIQD